MVSLSSFSLCLLSSYSLCVLSLYLSLSLSLFLFVLSLSHSHTFSLSPPLSSVYPARWAWGGKRNVAMLCLPLPHFLALSPCYLPPPSLSLSPSLFPSLSLSLPSLSVFFSLVLSVSMLSHSAPCTAVVSWDCRAGGKPVIGEISACAGAGYLRDKLDTVAGCRGCGFNLLMSERYGFVVPVNFGENAVDV